MRAIPWPITFVAAIGIGGLLAGCGSSVVRETSGSGEKPRVEKLKASGIKRQAASSSILILAEKGTAKAVIVALPEAGKPARFAAEELKAYLDRATGESFSIVEAAPESGPRILVGDSAMTRGLGVSVADLKRDGFILRRKGDVVVIAGRDEKDFAVRAFAEMTEDGSPYRKGWRQPGTPECATVFAAYAFLEHVAGVRWYFPGKDGEFVPQKAKLVIDTLDRREEPWFTYRRANCYGHYSLDPKNPNDMNDYLEMGITDRDVTYWALRNRRSTIHIPVNHMPPSHQFIDRFGKEHPDWFSMREDGSRENAVIPGASGASYGHLCYSNPELVKAVIADVDAFFSGRPAAERGLKAWNSLIANGDYFSLLPHDNIPVGCHCPECMKKKNTDGPKCGLLSDLIWGYVAEVGRAIEAKHPGKNVVCLAYNAYRGLPRHVRLPENVLPCPTALHTGNADDLPAQKAILQEIKDWRALVNRKVCLWVYSALECVDGKKIRGIPETEFRAMGRFYRAVKDDVIGSFWENDWAFGFQHHLDLYVYHRVTWDPETDVDAVVEEYCSNLYGPAAAEIHQFVNRVEELWTKRIVKSHSDTGNNPGGAAYRDIDATSDGDIWENIYSPAERERLTGWMDLAAAKVKGTDYAPHVALFRQRYFGPLQARWAQRMELEGLWKQLKPLPVDRFATPPVIDGRPDDSVWESAPADRVGTMVANAPDRKSKVPEQDTTVKLGWDDRNLYVLITCHENSIANLKAPKREFNDFGVGEDDEVEIFLDSSGARRSYQHYLVSAAGSLANRYVRDSVVTLAKAPGCQVKTWVYEHPERGVWYVEMAIQLGNQVPKPKPGDRWMANFVRARNSVPKTELSTWSPFVQGAFNQPDKFGILEFTSQERH